MKALSHKIFVLFALSLFPFSSLFADERAWQDIVEKAKGQTVFFNAWGGSPSINKYIQWVNQRVKDEYGVTVKHVKLSNTSDAIRTVLAEKAAGKNSGGTIDMIWINGENFRTMKENDLLFGPFAEQLPNFKYVDVKGKPTTRLDFGISTDGLESPWGMAQLVFSYDSAQFDKGSLPKNIKDFLRFAKQTERRFTYPAPPDFIGVTFLKQILYEVVKDDTILQRAPSNEEFKKATEPLWAYLEELHPLLWHKGRDFPKNSSEQDRLLNDFEIDFSINFNPGNASSAILNGTLPDSTRTFVLKKGTIGNTHFVAIPYNSSSTEGAQIVSNFLISPEAQAQKANPEIWGDPTVLKVRSLPKAERKLFADLPLGPATLSADELGKVLPEPHPEWTDRLKAAWIARYRS